MKHVSPFISKLILLLVCLVFSSVVYSQNIAIGDNNILSSDWLTENWAVLLLIVSEILALVPGSDSGILKIIITLIRKLTSSLSSNKKVIFKK